MVTRGDSPNSGCVDDADLQAALDGELSDAALELVHVHVAGCTVCSARLRAVSDERQQISSLLGQEDENEGEAVLASVARIERAVSLAPSQTEPIRRGSMLKRWGLAMAAAAGLVLAFSWPGSDLDVTAAPGRILDEAMVRGNAWMYQPEKVLQWVVELDVTGSSHLADGRYRSSHWFSSVSGAKANLIKRWDATGKLVSVHWQRPDGSVVSYSVSRSMRLQVEPSEAEIRASLETLSAEERRAANSVIEYRQQQVDVEFHRGRLATQLVDAASSRGPIHGEAITTPNGEEGYYIRQEFRSGPLLSPGMSRMVIETFIEAKGFRRYRLRTQREFADGRLWIEDARWLTFVESTLADLEANTPTDLLASMPSTKVTVKQLVQSRMSALTKSITAQ